MYIRKALLALAFLGFAVPVAHAQENDCQLSMKARLGVVVNSALKYGGEAVVRSCKGIYITIVATGKTFEAKQVFSETGYNFFEMNLEYIATTFVEPMPEAFAPEGWTFQHFPDPETITPDHSDLAVGQNGLADTIVFKFNDTSPVTVLTFYETSGVWFTEAAYGGS